MQLKRKIQTQGNRKEKASRVWVGGRQTKAHILSGKGRFLKQKGKIYVLTWDEKKEEPKITWIF